MNTPVRVGETIEGSRTMRNRPYQVLKCSIKVPPSRYRSEYRRETVLLFGRNGLLTSRSGLSRMTELAFARLRTIERLREAAPDIPTEQLSTAVN